MRRNLLSSSPLSTPQKTPALSFWIKGGERGEGWKGEQGSYNLRLEFECFDVGELGLGLRQKREPWGWRWGWQLGPCVHQEQQKTFTLEGKCGSQIKP